MFQHCYLSFIEISDFRAQSDMLLSLTLHRYPTGMMPAERLAILAHCLHQATLQFHIALPQFTAPYQLCVTQHLGVVQ